MAPEPGGLLDFPSFPWGEDQADIRSQAAQVLGQRWAIVEYEPGAIRPEYCLDGHRGFVLAGEIEYEFEDGSTLLAREGQGFWLAAGTGHRGRNPGDSVARLFLVDDPV